MDAAVDGSDSDEPNGELSIGRGTLRRMGGANDDDEFGSVTVGDTPHGLQDDRGSDATRSSPGPDPSARQQPLVSHDSSTDEEVGEANFENPPGPLWAPAHAAQHRRRRRAIRENGERRRGKTTRVIGEEGGNHRDERVDVISSGSDVPRGRSGARLSGSMSFSSDSSSAYSRMWSPSPTTSTGSFSSLVSDFDSVNSGDDDRLHSISGTDSGSPSGHHWKGGISSRSASQMGTDSGDSEGPSLYQLAAAALPDSHTNPSSPSRHQPSQSGSGTEDSVSPRQSAPMGSGLDASAGLTGEFGDITLDQLAEEGFPISPTHGSPQSQGQRLPSSSNGEGHSSSGRDREDSVSVGRSVRMGSGSLSPGSRQSHDRTPVTPPNSPDNASPHPTPFGPHPQDSESRASTDGSKSRGHQLPDRGDGELSSQGSHSGTPGSLGSRSSSGSDTAPSSRVTGDAETSSSGSSIASEQPDHFHHSGGSAQHSTNDDRDLSPLSGWKTEARMDRDGMSWGDSPSAADRGVGSQGFRSLTARFDDSHSVWPRNPPRLGGPLQNWPSVLANQQSLASRQLHRNVGFPDPLSLTSHSRVSTMTTRGSPRGLSQRVSGNLSPVPSSGSARSRQTALDEN